MADKHIATEKTATKEQIEHLYLLTKLNESIQFQIEHRRNEIEIRNQILNLKLSSNGNELKKFMKQSEI